MRTLLNSLGYLLTPLLALAMLGISACSSGSGSGSDDAAPAASFESAASATMSAGDGGLLAEYFGFATSLSTIPNFSGLTPDIVRNETHLNYASTSAAWPGLPWADRFAARYTGSIIIPTAGQWTFYTSSDDGSTLYINNQLVVNNNGLHGMQERSGTVSLSAGSHDFRVEFFENTGGAGLQARWAGPGITKQIIPATAFEIASEPDQPPAFTTQPSNRSVTVGSSAAFSVSVSGSPTPTLQWQRSNDSGSNWANISGATSTTYTLASAALSDHNARFRAVANNSAGSVTSNSATLTVTQPPAFTAQPSNRSVTVGSSAAFSVSVSGSPTPTLQWQRSNDSGSNWANISGATSTTYTLASAALSDNNARFRAIASNSAGSATSNSATLSVNEPASNGLLAEYYGLASNVSVVPNFTGLTPTVVRNEPNINIASTNAAWPGLPWADRFAARFTGTITIPTAGTWTFYTSSDDGSNLFINNQRIVNNDGPHGMQERSGTVSLSAGSHAFRVEFFENTGGAGLIASWAGPGVTKQVIPASAFSSETPAPVAPSFTAQPSNRTVTVGSSAAFTVSVSGSPSPTLQWQRSNDGGSNWANISGATSATYTLASAALSDHNARFRAIASNSAGTATSNSATLSVTQPPAFTAQPSNRSVTAGSSAAFSVSVSGSPSPTLQWQRSNDSGSSWSNISGATSTTYTLASAALSDHNARFRAIANNSAGTATSNSATLSVTSAATAPVITLASTLSASNDTITIAASVSNPSGPYTVAWTVVTASSVAPVFIHNTSVVSPTVSFPLNGTYRLRLTANNSDGLSSTKTIDVTLAAPAQTISGRVLDAGLPVSPAAPVQLRWTVLDATVATSLTASSNGAFSFPGVICDLEDIQVLVPAKN